MVLKEPAGKVKANWLSNGLGGQSMYMLYLAASRIIPSTLAITADTGSEHDRVCSTGERMSARTFFETYVVPFATEHGIEAVMVRANDENGTPLPALIDVLRSAKGDSFEKIVRGMGVPLYTCDRTNGQLKQSCTEKWKIRAIHQEARRRGIELLRSAIGYHAMESRRIKAAWVETSNGFEVYKPLRRRDGKLVPIKWLEHYYPLIDLGMNRIQIREQLDRLQIPYLITTECDHCPHQDWSRWSIHTPEVLEELAEIEAQWNGKLFLTDKRVPLRQALEVMREEDRIARELSAASGRLFVEPDFGCTNGAYCGI